MTKRDRAGHQDLFLNLPVIKTNFVIIRLFLAYSTILVICTSCHSNEIGNSKDVNPSTIFFDYKIRGDEADSEVTIYIQYRRGGPNGTTLVLNEPAGVTLDGEKIVVDSAKLTGAFYEIRKPRDLFKGKHFIIFRDLNEKEYKEEFEYHPFKLRTEIPEVVRRADLSFDLDGLLHEDYVRVIATDTSFTSKDIIEIDTVKNGRLTIPLAKLSDLVNGPITFLLSKETERVTRNGTREGGRVVVNYGLQREFILQD